MARQRVAIDGSNRRRLYLFRHGAVDYIGEDGELIGNPDLVKLNARGRAQAQAMARLFVDVHVDKAICTGLPRTLETGTTILADRGIELEVVSELEEIRPVKGKVSGGYDIVSDVAFSHWRAAQEDATFLGGERYRDFYERISGAMDRLLLDDSWHDLAVFAHGGTNAAILGWATGVGLQAFGLLDQSTCCLNVLDFDFDTDGTLLRKTIRGMNITADDPVMRTRDAGDMELLARRLLHGKI
ncbi:MAG: histidine phosphatase family protein [Gammaproteobacteria bacterium]|nr:histidine phosphatase family protein [Gammaproteobacteria bacterium]MDH5618261.1 histidine phosphatase family protein [Gammaproteobacteria bacterium]